MRWAFPYEVIDDEDQRVEPLVAMPLNFGDFFYLACEAGLASRQPFHNGQELVKPLIQERIVLCQALNDVFHTVQARMRIAVRAGGIHAV